MLNFYPLQVIFDPKVKQPEVTLRAAFFMAILVLGNNKG
ncbi:hypothetical protein ADICYQ_5378 [Cyclobacterium qasimii M12-11B]|uniref:Uncharacterized protein n=1 Tax=Cyclobacterium qasimii M12-11B TaxID=641524 RepID=S7V777_9BACT|nr:hypothetical protein ADICYQ_5378 [Cyclobacterium qasimii M12-11B]